jgi:hypothetical protein
LRRNVALDRYLQRHIETGLPDSPMPGERWQQALVVPAYREAPAMLERLGRLPPGPGRTLVILVLNRPDSDPDVESNRALREAVRELPPSGNCGGAGDGPRITALNRRTDLYCHDMERLQGPCPKTQGVGLARKTGFDIALKWLSQEGVRDGWICSTDADAQLPGDYFLRLQETADIAICFPFRHVPGSDPGCNRATALYELRLHHYLLGLEYAGSPYAWHSLGSCLAVRMEAYAQVRGFPRRAGGEDFYLLNKLTKVGRIAVPGGACIALQSRDSQRVPFGTGPAVAKISAAGDPLALSLFYHPRCFEALRAVLDAVPQTWQAPAAELPALLAARGLDATLQRACCGVLETLGIAAALAHCRRQGRTADQFLRQFHQWFDAFRTLKFIHGLRAAGWADQPLAALRQGPPPFWPPTMAGVPAPEGLCQGVRDYRGWLTGGDPPRW